MLINVIDSGSSANGYAIHAKDEILLIECGVKPKVALPRIGFEVMRVVGCIASHKHTDHLKYADLYQKYGFPIYMTPESKPAGKDFIKTFPRMKKTKIGAFEVVPFGVPHNGTECDGFLISHPGFGRLLFITDAEMCPYDMSKVGINHLLIECNYSLDYVDMTDINRAHVVLGHMELETCKRFVQTVYSDNLKTIGLIHLSKGHGDPDRFLAEVKEVAPNAEVWIAEKNKVLEV